MKKLWFVLPAVIVAISCQKVAIPEIPKSVIPEIDKSAIPDLRKSVISEIPAIGVKSNLQAWQGRWVEGDGDNEALALIDQAFETLQPSARTACLPLLYKRDWDGFVEGPTWPCWWIQNSFGPAYGMMPFLGEPYATWLDNSQALWFRQMGDGKRPDLNGLVGPDGCLVDAAFVWLNGSSFEGFGDPRTPHGGTADGKISSSGMWYRQGDGNVRSYDWFMGTTAAGLLLESERLLVRHDSNAARARLSQLKRVAAFLDSRRDPATNLLKAGRAANLLAPAYAGVRQPDGNFGKAYLTEVSVNYAAGLMRFAEVCELAGSPADARDCRGTAAAIRNALPRLMDEKGCFIMALDPDGTRHGVFGAARHGYFEATPNHDAVCFGVTNDEVSKKIIARMLSIPGLAPHGLILPNYPSYDDHSGEGNQSYGTWVNGGHWTTTQGRMSIACLRAGEYKHPFGAWRKMQPMMQAYRADSPLAGCGQMPWGGQLAQPYNVVYDCWGAPAGLLRGLFEYDYRAYSLRLRPHLPPGIYRYVQKSPVWFGKTKVWLTVTGSGAPVSARVNGGHCAIGKDGWIELSPNGQPGDLAVEIICGEARPRGAWKPLAPIPFVFPTDPAFWQPSSLAPATSGNNHPLRIGASPSGGHCFSGLVKDFRVYRMALSAYEIALLIKDGNFAGCTARFPLDQATGKCFFAEKNSSLAWIATLENAGTPKFQDGALKLDNGAFLELPSSAEIDFVANCTLAVWFRPTIIGDGARLIDRCTAGGNDGIMIDYVQNGKQLRLISPLGVVTAAVTLEANRWHHVAATCTDGGLMRLYLDGELVGETEGSKPAPQAKVSTAQQLNLRSIGAFYRGMAKAGKLETYEGTQARAVLDLLAARHERMRQRQAKTLVVPNIAPIPPANLDAVETLYLTTARKIAGGLVDRLNGRALWQPCADPGILDIARRSGLIDKKE